MQAFLRDYSHNIFMENNITFGESLKEILQIKNKSIKELKAATKISFSTIYSWLRNETEPSLSRLISLADFFDCSIDYLIGNSNIEENSKKQEYPPVAERIKSVLKEAGISTYKLKQISKYDGAYFYNWSHGSEPYLSTLKELAKLADCTIDYLIGRC